MGKQKHVLFILPSLIRSGAEIQTIDLIRGLPDEYIIKYLLTFEENLDQLDRLDKSKIRFYNKKRRFKYDMSIAKYVAKIINDENIDVVYCTLQISLLFGWIGRLIAKSKPKLIVAIHTTINRTFKDEVLDRFIYQWLMRTCNKIIYVCETQLEYWQSKYKFNTKNITAIHNGVDIDFFDRNNVINEGNEIKIKNSIENDVSVFCCIAALRPEKAHKILITAFNFIVKTYPNTLLFLAGDGPERVGLKSLIKQLSMEDNVIFLGNINDVRPILSISKCMIISSVSVETFSIAMLESMSMGVPVIATDIGGAKEAVINNYTGYLVKPGSVQSLRDAMGIIIKNNNISLMKENAMNLVHVKFTKDIMITKILHSILTV